MHTFNRVGIDVKHIGNSNLTVYTFSFIVPEDYSKGNCAGGVYNLVG